MRTRTVLAGFVVGLALVLTSPGLAHAQETTTTVVQQKSEVGDCVKKAVQQGTDPAKCQEAPNPILPATNEIVWGGMAFVLLLIALWKFALPPLKKGMSDRTERIRTDLERADGAKAEAEGVLAEYRAQLADAKTEATRIIEEARQTGDAVRADMQKRAEADILDMRQRAQADIEAAKIQAIADLRQEVGSLAIGAAELVVKKSLDRETQQQLVEDYINQVGARS
jgi:F-type H+-transporting ATPase subunit b